MDRHTVHLFDCIGARYDQASRKDAKYSVREIDDRLDSRLTSSILQRWNLWKADILLVSGLTDEALAAAHEGIVKFDFELRSSAFAGAFARWAALLGTSAKAEGEFRDNLHDLEGRLEEFDAIDQLEILFATYT